MKFFKVQERRRLLNNILCRKANWIGHILRRNCLLHDAIEGQMTEAKGVRRTQVLHDLRNRRRYWKKLKFEKDRDDSLSIEHKSLNLLISNILNNNIVSCAIWLWSMVSYIKGGTQAKGIWKEDPEANVRAQ
jgi:hypothetical protein